MSNTRHDDDEHADFAVIEGIPRFKLSLDMVRAPLAAKRRSRRCRH